MPDADLNTIAETARHLDAHIERRAREIADAEIQAAADQVRAALDEQAREREAADLRLAGVLDEVARQRRAWERQMDAFRAEIQRLTANSAEKDETNARLHAANLDLRAELARPVDAAAYRAEVGRLTCELDDARSLARFLRLELLEEHGRDDIDRTIRETELDLDDDEPLPDWLTTPTGGPTRD